MKKKNEQVRVEINQYFKISAIKARQIIKDLTAIQDKSKVVSDLIDYVDSHYSDLRERDYAFYIVGRFIEHNESMVKIEYVKETMRNLLKKP